MVNEMRVPSSSSSDIWLANLRGHYLPLERHTDGDGLDLDALLDMCRCGVIRLLVLEDLLAAERVDEGCPACA
jgi:hypothetical protein